MRSRLLFGLEEKYGIKLKKEKVANLKNAVDDGILQLQYAIAEFLMDRNGKGRETAVRGTALDQLIQIVKNVVEKCFPNKLEILIGKKACVPGFFRPSKNWDIVVKNNNDIIAAIELKSLVRSHGNNYNNRVEECLGCALDIKTYYKNLNKPCPFLGYLLVINDEECTQKKRRNFDLMMKKFTDTSYLDRKRIECEELVNQNIYHSAQLIEFTPHPKYCEQVEVNHSGFNIFLNNLIDHIQNVI